ncbi:hypothetical protein NEUTE1DRAFT_28526, partial [Neurospora tetrasperma FGSC 2508]
GAVPFLGSMLPCLPGQEKGWMEIEASRSNSCLPRLRLVSTACRGHIDALQLNVRARPAFLQIASFTSADRV